MISICRVICPPLPPQGAVPHLPAPLVVPFPRWLGLVRGVGLPLSLGQLPGVSVQRGPGLPHAGSHLNRPTWPTTISSGPTGALRGPLSATLNSSLRTARAQRSSAGQTASQYAQGLCRHPGVMLLRPIHDRVPAPTLPGAVLAFRSSAALPPDGVYLHLGPRALTGTSAAAGSSSGVPRCFRADRPQAASARSSTRGRGFSRVSRPTALVLAAGPGSPISTLR
ncbi:hypothetical protein NDU88_004170 [Pleurodeles waltl]|uniref:Uncharacterized protein n=1 Tax=Pleurodeles waltl TaxID=8319 RepID=A0AAV7M5K2_PLEWA|nr:hypothetical protein NDU88_004170 [Pleurodeles waltl]